MSAIKTVGEAIVKPVTDEVGQDLEQGAKAVISGPQQNLQTPLSSQQIQQTRANEQKIQSDARWIIDKYKKVADEQARVREQEKQKLQANKQEESKTKEVKQFEVVQKKKETQAQQAQQRSAAEKRIGKGVGG